MRLIVGVDEVGYGSIAGPLVVAATAFDETTEKFKIVWYNSHGKRRDLVVRDSKAVQHEMLPILARVIEKESVAHSVIVRNPPQIDEEGITKVRCDAMVLAVRRVIERTALIATYDDVDVIVDGDLDLGDCGFQYRAVPKADRDIWQVSAASILAKEIQVQAMQLLHQKKPQYGWSKNNGYPTPDHVAALKKHGVSVHHRRSYRTVRECHGA